MLYLTPHPQDANGVRKPGGHSSGELRALLACLHRTHLGAGVGHGRGSKGPPNLPPKQARWVFHSCPVALKADNMDHMDQQDAAPELTIVFYEPESTGQSTRRPPAHRGKWESIVNHILEGLSSDRQDVTLTFLHSLPSLLEEDPIQTARRLGNDIIEDENARTRPFKELLFTTLCMVLHKCEVNSPEETDQVLKLISSTSRSRYLDRLKRGARVANEIITEWAMQQGGGRDVLDDLGCATLALYTGRQALRGCAAPGVFAYRLRPRLPLELSMGSDRRFQDLGKVSYPLSSSPCDVCRRLTTFDSLSHRADH